MALLRQKPLLFQEDRMRVSSLFLALLMLFTSCASTTTIGTIPRGAEAMVYADGRYIGNAPARLTDSKISGSGTMITIEAEGYEDYKAYIEKSEHINTGALVGGIFLFVPFIWIMGYQPYYEFNLTEEKDLDTKSNDAK